jgi:hypothetical protein
LVINSFIATYPNGCAAKLEKTGVDSLCRNLTAEPDFNFGQEADEWLIAEWQEPKVS